jgi:hypothetical protein
LPVDEDECAALFLVAARHIFMEKEVAGGATVARTPCWFV